MNAHLVKPGQHVVHLESNGRPLCGGGYGAASTDWQTDIGPSNCKACLAIARRTTERQLITTTKQKLSISPK
jgi:hypothetical protein